MTKQELSTLVEEQAATIEAMETELAALKAANVLEAPIEAPKPITTPTETFRYGEDEYCFTVPRYIGKDSVVVNSKDSLKNPAELERLVLIEAGFLKKVN